MRRPKPSQALAGRGRTARLRGEYRPFPPRWTNP